MPRPTLKTCWLRESLVALDIPHQDLRTTPLAMGLELDNLTVVSVTPGSVEITVEWALSLYRGKEEVIADLSAEFVLTYALTAALETEQCRLLATRQAPADAWPMWRSWLFVNLGLMSLGPPDLPASMPRGYRTVAEQILEFKQKPGAGTADQAAP